MSRMHNPPHPGEFIRELYLVPHSLSVRAVARALGVAPSTLTRVINGESNITPEMAVKLSIALGRSAESWMNLQVAHDLWIARGVIDASQVQQIELAAA